MIFTIVRNKTVGLNPQQFINMAVDSLKGVKLRPRICGSVHHGESREVLCRGVPRTTTGLSSSRPTLFTYVVVFSATKDLDKLAGDMLRGNHQCVWCV